MTKSYFPARYGTGTVLYGKEMPVLSNYNPSIIFIADGTGSTPQGIYILAADGSKYISILRGYDDSLVDISGPLTTMQREIAELRGRAQAVPDQDGLQSKLQMLQTELSSVKDSYANEDLSELENSISSIKNELADIKRVASPTDVSELESSIDTIQKELADIKNATTDLSVLQEQIKEMQAIIEQLQNRQLALSDLTDVEISPEYLRGLDVLKYSGEDKRWKIGKMYSSGVIYVDGRSKNELHGKTVHDALVEIDEKVNAIADAVNSRVVSISAGDNITVDNSNPRSPKISVGSPDATLSGDPVPTSRKWVNGKDIYQSVVTGLFAGTGDFCVVLKEGATNLINVSGNVTFDNPKIQVPCNFSGKLSEREQAEFKVFLDIESGSIVLRGSMTESLEGVFAIVLEFTTA